MIFKDKQHQVNYQAVIRDMHKPLGRFNEAIAYLIAVDSECFKYRSEIYDFKNNSVKFSALSSNSFNEQSIKTVRIIVNIWNCYCEETEDFKDKKYSKYFGVLDIFPDTPLGDWYINALDIVSPNRFDDEL